MVHVKNLKNYSGGSKSRQSVSRPWLGQII